MKILTRVNINCHDFLWSGIVKTSHRQESALNGYLILSSGQASVVQNSAKMKLQSGPSN